MLENRGSVVMTGPFNNINKGIAMAKAAKKEKASVSDHDIDNFDDMMNKITAGLETVTTIDPAKAMEWIGSGNIAVNLACSGHPMNAFPFGRIINFEGESDTGKSLLAQTAMREAQQEYKHLFRGLYIDTERGVEITRLESMGMFCKWKPKEGQRIPDNEKDKYDFTGDPRAGTFRIVQSTDLATLADAIIPPFLAAARKRPDMRFVMCLDSVSLLVTTHERETGFDTRDMARAVEIRKFMRLLNDSFPANLIVFLIHHQSQRISTGTPLAAKTGSHDKDISGGKAVKYVPDVRIEVDYGGKEYRGSGDNQIIVGQIAKVRVIKTRLYRPMLEARAVIDHSKGFTQTGGLWGQLDDLGLINKDGRMWQCPEVTGDKKYYEGNLKDELEKPENAEKIIELIMARMQMATFGVEDAASVRAESDDAPAADPLGLGDL